MSSNYVLQPILEGRASFITGYHTSIDKLPSSVLHKLSELGLDFISLFVPPHGEEFHLGMGECLCLVFDERVEDTSVDFVNVGVEVLVDCVEPTSILVGVGDDMNSDDILLNIQITTSLA